ncbi:MAG: BatA domain-containing protein [Clostridia bacterium]|nr:BatA domain-containing protein [Deltaproteobacteria bacterium]
MGELTFLYPYLLGGAALASLPVIIHLIGRRRAPVVRFAAFDFLMAVNKRLAKRERLRQFLLLLLRTLAILALVFAAARPMPKRLAAAGTGARRLAIVLDASASMRFVRQGKPLLDTAKHDVRDLVSHLAPGDMATLIIAGREVTPVFQSPTLALAAVRAAVEKVTVAEGVANLGTAIDRALAQLGSDGSNATLVVVTDLAENSFVNLRPTAMEPPPEVRLIDAAHRDTPPKALANIAVTNILVEGTGEQPSERRIRVTVRNYGSDAVSGVSLELRVGNETTQRVTIDVNGSASVDKVLMYAFAGTGAHRCEARLVFDASPYPFDDTMAFVVDIAPSVRVLAVDGDPRTTPYDDELFFFEKALAAVPKGEPPIELTIIAHDELTTDFSLEGFDAIILANVRDVAPDVVTHLRAFVNAGHGLLFTLGSEVKFDTYNTLFGDLLPHPLRDLTKAADDVAGNPPLAIGDVDWEHPVLAGLGAAAQESLRASRTRSLWNLDVGGRTKTLSILRFDNGAPALTERRSASGGRVLMLTTSIDVDMSDIALRSAFPALAQRTVRYVARAIGAASVAPVRVGDNVQLPVPTEAGELALVAPAGTRVEKSSEDGARRKLEFGPLVETGFYTASAKDTDWHPAPRLDVAVNASLDESDWKPVVPERLSEALGGEGGQVVSVSMGAGEHDNPFQQRGYASYLLIALCFVFIGESLLASRG